MTNPWVIAVSVMLATFMEVLDTSVAAVALPYIAGTLSATNDEATWVLTSYLVANAVVLPASGWFSLRFGRKRFLIVCIMVFTAASFACGAANSLGFILLARAVQGAGGGALQPLSQAILLESFPPAKRGAAMAVFGLGIVVAPVLGPTLGGWLTDSISWRWAFYINVPIGVLAVVLIGRFVKDPPYIKCAKTGRIDLIGLGLLALGLACLQVILDKGQEDDWFGATWIRWATAVMVAAFIAFLVVELRRKEPIVRLGIFRNRNFTFGCVLIAAFGAAIYGITTLLPLFYQTLLGYNATAAGFAVAPRGVGAILIMPVIAVLTSRLDNRWLIACGFTLFCASTLWLGELTLDISQWSLLWPVMLSGMAAGLVFVPLATTSLGTLDNRDIGNASGLFNLLRNIGGSVGIGVVNALVIRHTQRHRNEMVKYLAPGTPAFERTRNGLRESLAHALSARPGKLPDFLLDRMLTRQASYWSYVDVFRYMGIACLLCAPLVFMMCKVKAKKGAVAAEG